MFYFLNFYNNLYFSLPTNTYYFWNLVLFVILFCVQLLTGIIIFLNIDINALLSCWISAYFNYNYSWLVIKLHILLSKVIFVLIIFHIFKCLFSYVCNPNPSYVFLLFILLISLLLVIFDLFLFYDIINNFMSVNYVSLDSRKLFNSVVHFGIIFSISISNTYKPFVSYSVSYYLNNWNVDIASFKVLSLEFINGRSDLKINSFEDFLRLLDISFSGNYKIVNVPSRIKIVKRLSYNYNNKFIWCLSKFRHLNSSNLNKVNISPSNIKALVMILNFRYNSSGEYFLENKDYIKDFLNSGLFYTIKSTNSVRIHVVDKYNFLYYYFAYKLGLWVLYEKILVNTVYYNKIFYIRKYRVSESKKLYLNEIEVNYVNCISNSSKLNYEFNCYLSDKGFKSSYMILCSDYERLFPNAIIEKAFN